MMDATSAPQPHRRGFSSTVNTRPVRAACASTVWVSSGTKHRNVRAGSPAFRLAAAIRRRLLAFGSFLERSGERAARLSLFRAGEFLRHPLPRRIRVHPTLAARTTGLAVAALAHKVTPALEERGIRPDLVCGASIGALVGAIYAEGRLDEFEP